MRFVILLMFGSVVIGSACLRPPGSAENARYVTVIEPEIYFRGKIDSMHIKLHDVEGRCVISYSANDQTNMTDLEVGMQSPCNFIRRGGQQDYKPLSYTYQEGLNRRTVLLITGGPPDPSAPDAKDQFQPEGCGTWQAKIRVFSDRIEIAWSGFNGPAWCPTAGADEVMFAA